MHPRHDEIPRMILRHLPRVEGAVREMRHPHAEGFRRLIDAIRWQAEAGAATPETIYPVAAAIILLARTSGIDPDAVGLSRAILPLLALAELKLPPCNCSTCQR